MKYLLLFLFLLISNLVSAQTNSPIKVHVSIIRFVINLDPQEAISPSVTDVVFKSTDYQVKYKREFSAYEIDRGSNQKILVTAMDLKAPKIGCYKLNSRSIKAIPMPSNSNDSIAIINLNYVSTFSFELDCENSKRQININNKPYSVNSTSPLIFDSLTKDSILDINFKFGAIPIPIRYKIKDHISKLPTRDSLDLILKTSCPNNNSVLTKLSSLMALPLMYFNLKKCQ